jgi:hypothetical protein
MPTERFDILSNPNKTDKETRSGRTHNKAYAMAVDIKA